MKFTKKKLKQTVSGVNKTQYNPNSNKGFYESYFLRANHENKPFGFWIRYTIFVPNNFAEKSIAELWFSYFNGETKKHTFLKKETSLLNCKFDKYKFNIIIGNSYLNEKNFNGEISSNKTNIKWDMTYLRNFKPLYLFPKYLYKTKFPKAKVVVSAPLAKFNGKITINNEKILINNWVGSQNHNWGQKHTDEYAWGQVSGFENNKKSFLEIATAKIKIGKFKTPSMTVIVLRHNGVEYRLNSIVDSLKALGKYSYFKWNFTSENKKVKITGVIIAKKNDFVALRYYNPTGGFKQCLNTKIAFCKIKFIDKLNNKEEVLKTENKAAFEILTDNSDHGINLIL